MSKETVRRDSSIDRLLPGALEAHAEAAPPNACLDAGLVAAWADDTLTAQERAAAEAHAADCVRCQSVLMAMIATAPEPAKETRSWMPSLGWLVPLTAAAAAALVWMAVPQRPVVRQQSRPAVEVADARSTKPSSAVEDKKPVADEVQPLGSGPAMEPSRRQAAARPLEQSEGAAKDASASASALASTDANATLKSAPPRAPANEPPATASAESTARGAVPAPRRFAALSAAAPMPVIVSSNPAIRWRIVNGGGVQHTTDGGATWQLQQTGAAETLTAGSSPAPSVCWLVGPHGIVVRWIDDRTWQRVSFPEKADLVSVSADDGQTASVTTADGRTLATADGGRSWSRP